jgi:hypothetical protein
MKKFLSLAAAALAVGLVMAPQDASARPFGGGFRMGGFHHGGFRGFHGGFRGFHGGFRPAAFHGGFRHGFRPVAFGRPFVFHRHRRFFPVGALATGALIGAAAASSYYPTTTRRPTASTTTATRRSNGFRRLTAGAAPG